MAASKGNCPIVVSPEVMFASVRSKQEFVISETSALVGLGFVYIDSSIWVAVTTNFPWLIALSVMYFWSTTTFSIGTYIPKSPLATIIPSEASTISSILSIASWFSILLTKRILGPCYGSFSARNFLRLIRSDLYRAKDTAI